MERLTINTVKGYCLKLNEPKNDTEARKQLSEKYLMAINKLARLENKEEKGCLIEVHCCAGDTIWEINIFSDEPKSCEVCRIEIYRNLRIFIKYRYNDEWVKTCGGLVNNDYKACENTKFGETIFLTKEEAVQAIIERKKKNNMPCEVSK